MKKHLTISELQVNRHRRFDPVANGYKDLAVAVLAGGVKEEGLEYLDTEDGRWWLEALGVDSDETLGYLERIARRAS